MWNFKIYMSLYKIYKIQILKKQFMRAIYSDLPPSAHSKLMDPRASILHPTLPWLYAAHLMSGSFAAPGKARHLEHILESGTCGAHHGSSCTGGGYWGVWRRHGGKVRLLRESQIVILWLVTQKANCAGTRLITAWSGSAWGENREQAFSVWQEELYMV